MGLTRLAYVALLATIVAAGCSKEIGDDCRTSIDCSQESERTCDISQPGGYCTIEGCDERSCPEEAVCIRFFPRQYLTKKCADPPGCGSDELCLDDGLCAPRSSERRYCAKKCGDGDCRSSYECRTAGTEGSMALVAKPESRVRFCAPSAR